MQEQPAADAKVGPASKEVAERLENALLDTMFKDVDPKGASKQEQESLREEFRGYIRETEGYNKMIQSGDANVNAILNDLPKMARVYSDVVQSILAKLEPSRKSPEPVEPQRNNEKQMEPATRGPLGM